MQKRIIISILLSVALILISLGVISYYNIQESIERSYEERLAQARIIAATIDRAVEENLTRLYDISLSDRIDLADGSWDPEQDALRTAYQYSLFADGIYLLDRAGRILLTYPPRDGWSANLAGFPPVSRGTADIRPVISNIVTLEPSKRRVLFALVPLRSRNGDIVGTAGGLIDPTSHHFTRILESLTLEHGTHVDLVDSSGIVIASNDPRSILSGIDHNRFLSRLIAERKSTIANCHRCHAPDQPGHADRSDDILAFSPLNLAPWGIALRFPKNQVIEPSRSLQRGFLLLGIIALVSSLVLALGMSRSIVKPVQQLIRATDRIARGDLTVPVAVESADEISTLAQHFDHMRTKLAASLESITRHSAELEQRVLMRTRQLMEKQILNESLLRRLITSQEDERKRIARELHDDSLQSLSALIMNVEMCRLHPETMTSERVLQMKETVAKVMQEMTKVIQNLRPTVLDDLGFEAGVVWLIEQNLKERGITCFMNLHELVEGRIPSSLQVTLFRIFQETTTNIARHAGAEHVCIAMRNDDRLFTMSVEDDGVGFDTRTVFENTMTGRGLGIMGMKERAAQVNGRFTVCSAPGQGTMVWCSVPLIEEGP
jgi:signal transduction histidine kinase